MIALLKKDIFVMDKQMRLLVILDRAGALAQ